MPRFQISTQGRTAVEVTAGNWLIALGLGLDRLDAVDALDRLACEVLPNHRVIARDARVGTTFIVVPLMEAMGTAPGNPTFREDSRGPQGVPTPESDDVLALGEDDDEDVYDDESSEPTDVDAAALRRLGQAADETDAWGTALRLVQDDIPCDSGAAFRLEGDGSLRFVAATGPHAGGLEGRRLDPGTGFVGFCVQRDMALIVAQPQHDVRFHAAVDQLTGYTTESVLCVPVRGADGRMLGCLELLNAPSGFHDADRRRAEAVASALATQLKKVD